MRQKSRSKNVIDRRFFLLHWNWKLEVCNLPEVWHLSRCLVIWRTVTYYFTWLSAAVSPVVIITLNVLMQIVSSLTGIENSSRGKVTNYVEEQHFICFCPAIFWGFKHFRLYYVLLLDLYSSVTVWSKCSGLSQDIQQCYPDTLLWIGRRVTRYVLDTGGHPAVSCVAVYTNVSLREASSWGSECRVLAKPQWDLYIFNPSSLWAPLLDVDGIYSRHFRWLWLCINIGWMWDISGMVLKILKHILAGIISHELRTVAFPCLICSWPHTQICLWFVVVGMLAELLFFLLFCYRGMQRDSICLTSSATTSTCWRKTILASDMWIQTSSG